MNIGWMKKTLQVEIISKDNGYVFSYTKDWLYKHRNRFEYVFHEVDEDGKDIYYSNYDIADDGTITIETSGGGEGGGSEPLKVTVAISYDEDSGITTYTCNKTWQEIHDAYPNVVLSATITNEGMTSESMGLASEVVKVTSPDNPDAYGIITTLDIERNALMASSPDGYPSIVTGIG